MKYFLHDSNSFNDEKVTQLYIKFGYEGLGLFYTTLEKLSQQEKPMITEVLKHQLKVGKKLNKIWLFMESIDLISSNNGETFNKQLLNFSEKYKIKKEKNRKRISDWRDNQEDSKNVTCNKDVRNTSKVNRSKVNRSKVNRSKDNEYSDEVKNFTQSLLVYFTIPHSNLKNVYRDIELLITKDGYTEERITEIVKHFRNDEFWIKNFQSLLKLRKKNKEEIKYIDYFDSQLKVEKPKKKPYSL